MMLKKLLIKDNIILIYTGVLVLMAYFAFIDYKAGNYLDAIINTFCTGMYAGYISLRFITLRLGLLIDEFKEANIHNHKVIAIQHDLIQEQDKLIKKQKEVARLDSLIIAATKKG